MRSFIGLLRTLKIQEIQDIIWNFNGSLRILQIPETQKTLKIQVMNEIISTLFGSLETLKKNKKSYPIIEKFYTSHSI